MNYLLVMPQVTKIKEQQYSFPIGIAYVSASFKAVVVENRNIFTLNLNYKEDSLHNILREQIENNEIDVLATGGITAQYQQIKEIIDTAKSIKPQIKIIVGGGLVTSDPIPAMQALKTADYGIIGEGEITICELAEALENKRKISTVDGIVYKKKCVWAVTNPRAEIIDLDSMPFPDYEGFEFAKLLTKIPTDIYALSGNRGNVVTVSFGRSCPFNCTFCFHTSGSTYRQRSLDSIFMELDQLLEKYPIDTLAITDELFAYKHDYVEEFCRRIKKYNISFVISLRVDVVTKELLQKLKDNGCLSVSVGLESADNRILKSMRKQITVEQIDRALTLANEVGVNMQGNFIFGDLEETVETAMNTINWWKEHPEFQIALHWIVVYPGSHLYKVACERGVITDKIEHIKNGCPYINVSKMSDQEYKEISLLIDSLSLQRTDFLTEVEIFRNDFGKVDIEGNCPVCQQRNKFTSLDVFRTLSNTICKNCNKAINLLVADYIDDSFDNNIKNLTRDRKIAIWPVTNTVTTMFSKAPALLNENVYVVDSSTFKIGGVFQNKTIHSPEILNEENIDLAIIPLTTSVAAEIVGIIEKKYLSVKHIVYAGELINENFKLKESK